MFAAGLRLPAGVRLEAPGRAQTARAVGLDDRVRRRQPGVAVVVIRNLATPGSEGIASAYVDAFTWFVLPYGLLAVSIATTFQPEMARAVLHATVPIRRRLSQGRG